MTDPSRRTPQDLARRRVVSDAAAGWLPPDYPADRRIRLRPAGSDWDAIRAPYYLGQPALEELDEECGAVIYDTRESALYWLTKPGSTAGWNLPYTRCLSRTHYLAVPALSAQPPGVHWLIPPTENRLLTDIEPLRAALTHAVRAHLGPREQAGTPYGVR